MHINSKTPHAATQGLCAGCGCAVRSVIRDLSRSFEAANPGAKAPSFASIMAEINAGARAR